VRGDGDLDFEAGKGRAVKRGLALGIALAGCGGGATEATAPQVSSAMSAAAPCPEAAHYAAHAAPSGSAPALPEPPNVGSRPIQEGGAYTVWGAAHHLRSRVHRGDVDGQRITIVGTIVRTNYDAAPRCAVHRAGVADKPDCHAPVPSFAIADGKGELQSAVEVMGWASNFAQIYTMIDAIDKAAPGKEGQLKLVDEFWGMPLPNPIPAVGATVRVTGRYGVTFTKASGGAASNPRYGIMTAERIEVVEPARERAYLPGMKPAGR
jgi:hypothetical protein